MVVAELGGPNSVRQGEAWAGNRGFLRGGVGRGKSHAATAGENEAQQLEVSGAPSGRARDLEGPLSASAGRG